MKTLPIRETSRSIKLPAFFPDATQGVVRTLDSQDVARTNTPGVLVNTYHFLRHFGKKITPFKSVRELMDWEGATISDSGGFQVLSLIHNHSRGQITDKGAWFQPENQPKTLLTPELSLQVQFELGTDLMVVLDDFTPPTATKAQAAQTVERTLDWAVRSKKEYERQCKKRRLKQKPKLIGVVQGGVYQELRKECAQGLVKIGFDGLGYGGWPVDQEGRFDYQSARTIAKLAPKDYYLYGLGIGKPEDIVGCTKLGFNIFDCVLPTRDARHRRLYVFNPAKKIGQKGFYSYLDLNKSKHLKEKGAVDSNCDCQLCQNYSLGYLAHLFRIGDSTAFRLATIHNLRFYAQLMERLSEK